MKLNYVFSMLAMLLLGAGPALAQTKQQCLLEQLDKATDNQTIGDIKAACQQLVGHDLSKKSPVNNTVESTSLYSNATSAITRRLVLERAKYNNPFSLLPHKPNYIILSNNLASANERPFEQASPNDDIHFQPWETKFQFSLKVPVKRDIFNRADLFVAYTNRSFWQQFNSDSSSPFRNSDHEPEIWLSFKNNSQLFGLQNRIIRAGISHQSNGQSGSLSRSWNRLYADFIFERDDWYFSLKPWWRISEDTGDDNPDIDDYMGQFEFSGLYKHGTHNFEFMIRNNLESSDNHGAIQVGWSFPITKHVRGYAQWFNGYGESLIDYNAYSNSLGFGIQLSDWL